MDDATTGAATAVLHADANDAERWFEVLRAADAECQEAGSPDWSAFRDALSRHASSEGFPAEAPEAFFEYAEQESGDPMAMMAELVDPGNAGELMQAYQAAVDAADSGEDFSAFDARDLTWVSEDQVAVLDGLAQARGPWTDWLPAQLDEWWADWADSTADVLAPWLDQYLPLLSPADVRQLGWVTSEQVVVLEEHTDVRGPWTEWLPAQLDEWWADWADSPPDVLAPWLDDFLPTLAGSADDAAAFDPRELTWLTPEQIAILDTLTDARGPRAEWLPSQMDEWWPGWTESDAATLVDWLTEALPALTVADEPEGSAQDESAPEAAPEAAAETTEATEATGDEDEDEDEEVNGDVVADQVLSTIVNDAALELDDFSDISDEVFAELLNSVLDDELQSHDADA